MRDMPGNDADRLSRLRAVVGDNDFGLAAIDVSRFRGQDKPDGLAGWLNTDGCRGPARSVLVCAIGRAGSSSPRSRRSAQR